MLLRMWTELDCGVDLPGHALAVVALLEDDDADVRLMAVETLGKLEAAALAQHAAAVVGKLEDSDANVRLVAAVQTLGKLDAASLAPHAAALKSMLEDSEVTVQLGARLPLHKLEPAAGHMDAVVGILVDSAWDSEWRLRHAAVETLGKLDAALLAQHVQALAKVAKTDADEHVRAEASKVLAEAGQQ